MRLFLAFFLLLSAAISQASDNPGPAWKDAMTAYKAGEFEKALEGFRKIADDEQQVSAALCHNIANCAWRLDDKAAASIWYRRALALDRWLPEAHQNLRFLERTVGFHRFDQDGIVKFAGLLPRKHWIAVCQGAIWITGIAIVWLVWLTPRPGRRWPLVTLLSIAFAVIGTTVCGLVGKSMDKTPFVKRLVSTPAENAFARSAPAEAAGTVIALPPGSELFPIRKEGLWTYCDIPGGDKDAPLRGWVRNVTTEPLWPWNASLVE